MNPEPAWEPFSDGAGEQSPYRPRGQEEAWARLWYVIGEQGLGVLTGEIGSGKSTLLRQARRALDPLRYTDVYVSLPGLRPKDFYGELLSHLGETPPYTLAGARRLWQERSDTLLSEGAKQWVVWVDEAQEMTDAMLEELRFVHRRQTDARPLFAFILSGQPELRRRLRMRRHEAITQRVTAAYHLAGMTKEETAAYIRTQMERASRRVLFADSAVAVVYRASQGLPRVVNQLCRQVLFATASTDREVVEESEIQRVLADQEKQRGTAG